MATNLSGTEPNDRPMQAGEVAAPSPVPKKITNAQTVCNEKNAKGKLCNGHLKQLKTGGEAAEVHLRGDDALFKCQTCKTLYMGPPLGHVRDPDKQQRFVERELSAILQAAGGSLPAFKRTEKGAWVPVEDHSHHAAAPAQPSPVTAKTVPKTAQPTQAQTAPAQAPTTKKSPEATPPPSAASSSASPAKIAKGYVPPPAPGPVPGETHEQKIARLSAIVAEAKRRKAAADAEESGGSSPEVQPVIHTQPAAASTSGTDSSPQADEHRAEAEAQAATGQASAFPLSSASATASPAALAETAERQSDPTVPSVKPKPLAVSGPVPGETHEQKILRLQQVVNAARIRDGKPPKY